MLSFPNTNNQAGLSNTLYDDYGNKTVITDEILNKFDTSKIKSFNVNINGTIKKEMISPSMLNISNNNYRIERRPITGAGWTQLQGQTIDPGDDGTEGYNVYGEDNSVMSWGEDINKLPAGILTTINRYTRIYKTPVSNLMAAGADKTEVAGAADISGGQQASQQSNGQQSADSQQGGQQNGQQSGTQNTQQNNNNQQSNQGTDNSSATESEKEKTTSPPWMNIHGLKTQVVSSIFNPNHMIQVNGLLDNLPVVNIKATKGESWVNLGNISYFDGTDNSWTTTEKDKDGKESKKTTDNSYFYRPVEVPVWKINIGDETKNDDDNYLTAAIKNILKEERDVLNTTVVTEKDKDGKERQVTKTNSSSDEGGSTKRQVKTFAFLDESGKVVNDNVTAADIDRPRYYEPPKDNTNRKANSSTSKEEQEIKKNDGKWQREASTGFVYYTIHRQETVSSSSSSGSSNNPSSQESSGSTPTSDNHKPVPGIQMAIKKDPSSSGGSTGGNSTNQQTKKQGKTASKKSSKPKKEWVAHKYYLYEKISQRDIMAEMLATNENLQVENGNLVVKVNYNPFDTRTMTNTANCTIRELVRRSHSPNGSLGMAKYRYADFLFCKNIGKVSNNHMITLRRFAHPVGDNIFRYSGKGYLNTKKPNYHGFQENSGMGTLITWFGTDDNKLEDILNYSVKSTWKEFKSKIQEIDTSANDSEAGGLIGMIANSFSPGYNSLVAQGMAGSNSLWGKLGSSIFGGTLGKLGLPNAANGGVNSNSMKKWDLMRMSADNNKIYTPQNTIQATHKYEGELVLSHEFTLNFSYRLRALDVMNPKTVMLDLIGNILEVTYNRGHFWGGARRFIGPPQNSTGIAKANAFIDRQWEKLEGFMMGFANGTLDWKGILSSISDAVSAAVSAIKGAAEAKGGFKNMILDGSRKLVGKFVSSGASRAMLGQLKNSLGRPAVYAMDSLLSGEPVGLWHVTIGNPKNPIAAFGNLILTNTKISHSGPLGFDDFPTEIKVSCTLKHGRSRDLSEVARMYTKGSGAFYNALDKNKLSEFFSVSNTAAGQQIETDMDFAAMARNYVAQLEGMNAKIKDLEAQIEAKNAEIKQCKQQIEDLDKKEKEEKENAKKQQQSSASASSGGGGSSIPRPNPSLRAAAATQSGGSSGSGSGTSGTDYKAQKQQLRDKIKQLQEEIKKLENQIQQLKKDQVEYIKILNDETGSTTDGVVLSKYVDPNYSIMYGAKMDENTVSKMRDTTQELYKDMEGAHAGTDMTTSDSVLYGHFINSDWALRYETLGQDLDREGRILIDENA